MNLLGILAFSLLSFITGADSIGAPAGADLLFVGDAMQHQAQLDRARELGGGKGYDWNECYSLIAPDITAADYAVCNLEVPLGGGPDYSGYPCFSAPDNYAQALKDAGFDMFLTANNHCLDRGDKGARATIKALDRLGVDHVGTYADSLQRTQRVPFIRDIKGIKVGFLNYTYGTNGIEPRDGIEVSMIDRDRMAREIKATREAGAEILVVAVHWGVEYVLLPGQAQKDLARFLVDQGVDMVIGGHPHVIQPMEHEDGRHARRRAGQGAHRARCRRQGALREGRVRHILLAEAPRAARQLQGGALAYGRPHTGRAESALGAVRPQRAPHIRPTQQKRAVIVTRQYNIRNGNSAIQ